jgi:hypothetical protein
MWENIFFRIDYLTLTHGGAVSQRNLNAELVKNFKVEHLTAAQ